MNMKCTVILEPQEEGGYTVRCLELPGAISQGETEEEALINIKEAIDLVQDVLSEELKARSRVADPEGGVG